MNQSTQRDRDNARSDSGLRAAMKHLAPPLDASAFSGLEARVMNQWRATRTAPHEDAQRPATILTLHLSKRRLAVLLLTVAAIGGFAFSKYLGHKQSTDALLEPDVLSFIAMDEL